MTKLTGYEASVLAFLAMFPLSRAAREKAEALTGEAKSIANALLANAEADVPVSSSSETAKKIRAWADAPQQHRHP